MRTFELIVSVCGGLSTIFTLLAILIKPIREKLFGIKAQREQMKAQAEVQNKGIECLLRSQILSTYYACLDKGEIRQYQRENVTLLYMAYKAMGGNSFIQDVYDKIREFKVIS